MGDNPCPQGAHSRFIARGSGVLLYAYQQDLQERRRRSLGSRGSSSDHGVPWYKHSHYGQFQATNVTSLKAEMRQQLSWLQHTTEREVDICISIGPMARVEKFIGSERKAARANSDIYFP